MLRSLRWPSLRSPLLAAVALLCAAVPLRARAASFEVPVDVGVGPAGYYFFGPVMQERGALPHFGLELNLHAVIDQALLRRNRGRIPARYRKLAASVTEVRISPSPFIPHSLLLSPKLPGLGQTGVFGVTWRPVSLALPLLSQEGVALRLSAGLVATYAFLYSDVLPTTHFLRPGLDGQLELELFPVESFGVSLGWASAVYVPQQLGSFGIGPLEESIFHVGHAFLKLHFRFPYTWRG